MQQQSIPASDRETAVRQIGDHRGYLGRVIRARIDPRLSSRLDVSDIIQDAQIEALRRLDGYLSSPTVTLRRWLRSIARDQTVMACRKHLGATKRSVAKEAGTQLDADGTLARLIGASETPSGIVSQRQEVARVHAAIESLSAPEQQVIRLQVFEQLSSEQAAAIIGISTVAFRQRFCRALVRLRLKMKDSVQRTGSIP